MVRVQVMERGGNRARLSARAEAGVLSECEHVLNTKNQKPEELRQAFFIPKTFKLHPATTPKTA